MGWKSNLLLWIVVTAIEDTSGDHYICGSRRSFDVCCFVCTLLSGHQGLDENNLFCILLCNSYAVAFSVFAMMGFRS